MKEIPGGPKPILTWTRVNLGLPAIMLIVFALMRVGQPPELSYLPAAVTLSLMAQFAVFVMNLFACRPHSKGLWPLQVVLALGSTLFASALIFVGCAANF